MNTINLQSIAYQCLLDLVTEDGINASGREEIFGCLFGRDSTISIITILRALQKYPKTDAIDNLKLVEICKQTLTTLSRLQGQEVNLESGEEPGKILHEYRKSKFEHLVTGERPWYLYPDGTLKNYDSIDSTPLFLIALYKYWEVSGDNTFIQAQLPVIHKALNWIMTYGDKDEDYLLEYELPTIRQHGGLPVQSWTDSVESLKQADGSFPLYPIAPVEVQGYAWLALRRWADFFRTADPIRSDQLSAHARRLKTAFNQKFLMVDNGRFFAAQALDGSKNQITTITGNPLLLLWATYTLPLAHEAIVNEDYIGNFVSRAFEADLFDPDAGIRTMSSLSPTYNPGQDSYHNGSFWPKLNGMAHEGLLVWGYHREARMLRTATIKPLEYFQTPIELYVKNGEGTYLEFKTASGQTSCRSQAWSAAVAFDLAAPGLLPDTPTLPN